MPQGYGSVGCPKGQSNLKNHKAGSKREGSGRKILTSNTSDKLALYFSANQ